MASSSTVPTDVIPVSSLSESAQRTPDALRPGPRALLPPALPSAGGGGQLERPLALPPIGPTFPLNQGPGLVTGVTCADSGNQFLSADSVTGSSGLALV